ncbi:MAG: hypothetical protein ACRDFB_08475 [Rhabdochlamydiaceae bacterium]
MILGLAYLLLPISAAEVRLVGAGGEDLGSIGRLIATVTIGDQTIKFSFIVADGIKADIILGNDVMKELGLKIDLDNEVIKTMSGYSVPIDIYKPREGKEDEVLVKKQIIIPPRTACLAEVKYILLSSILLTLRSIFQVAL